MGNAPYFDQINLDTVRAAYDRMGYTFYESGNYNINIFAVRTNECTSNAFNDVIGLAYKVDGVWVVDKYNATVDPGVVSRTNPVNSCGCAIIVPGQYRGCWRLGMHRNKYPALVQNKPIKLYRDNDRDTELDCNSASIVEELTGINIHHAGADSKQVDNWSAGCMVIANRNDWDKFFNVVLESSKRYGEVFTATLFTETQFLGAC